MKLKINTISESYKEFEGRTLCQMPRLRVEGRVPLNIAQFMQLRLDFEKGSAEFKFDWSDKFFDTGDAGIYHPNGDVKVVLDCPNLREMTPQSQRSRGALVLSEEVYHYLPGKVFKQETFGELYNHLFREDANSNPLWQFLARDQGLLEDYTTLIFAEGKRRFRYNTAMKIFPGYCFGDKPEMRSWGFGWLGNGSLNSSDLDYPFGHLVGMLSK